ncbi:MAG TPA: nucleotidyltransferase family protein [Stellaceae bacterium]|nr:nucleotidyltransferase family protein [Stellaceae bacterium]
MPDHPIPSDADKFIDQALTNPLNRIILERLPTLGLPDAWLVAGCLYQTVWNRLAGRSPGALIKDYDIFYFDDADLSWDAEDRAIRRAERCFADLGITVELRNQARVHLWYAERFGPGYPALRSSRDGIDRYLVECTCVALAPTPGGAPELYAPYGLGDLYDGILRPNPINPRPALFAAKAASYRARWPWLRVAGI